MNIDYLQVTKWLEGLNDENEKFRLLYEAYKETIRAQVSRNLSPAVKRVHSPTGIANGVFEEVMRDNAGAKPPFANRKIFRATLLARAKQRAQDAARYEKSGPRDIDRNEYETEDYSESADLLPEAKAAACELGVEIGTMILKEENDIKRHVQLLGIMRSYSAPEIRQILENAAGERGWKTVPAERTIQKYLEHLRKRIAAKYKVKLGESARNQRPDTSDSQD